MHWSGLLGQAAYILLPEGFKDKTGKPVGNNLLLTDNLDNYIKTGWLLEALPYPVVQ